MYKRTKIENKLIDKIDEFLNDFEDFEQPFINNNGDIIAIGARDWSYSSPGYVRVFQYTPTGNASWTQMGGDIDGEADLVEEVLRIIGYDKIPPISLPKTNTSKKNKLPLIDQRAGRTRRALATRGLLEKVTYYFISKAKFYLKIDNH